MNSIGEWGGAFNGSLSEIWHAFIGFVPGFLGAIILFIIGWILASLLGKAIAQLITAIKLDKLFESAGAAAFMQKTGLKINVSGIVGILVKWFIIIVFLMASLQIVGLTQVNDFIKDSVLPYLLNVIIASLVLVIATVVADVMSKIVSGSAKAMNLESANMLGSISKYAIWIFGLIIALSELGLAPYMQTLFVGFIAAFALAFGLAFGLGGRDAASKVIEHVKDRISSR